MIACEGSQASSGHGTLTRSRLSHLGPSLRGGAENATTPGVGMDEIAATTYVRIALTLLERRNCAQVYPLCAYPATHCCIARVRAYAYEVCSLHKQDVFRYATPLFWLVSYLVHYYYYVCLQTMYRIYMFHSDMNRILQ